MGFVSKAVLVALVAVAAFWTLSRWRSNPDQPFAFLTSHNTTATPSNYYSRIRIDELNIDFSKQHFYQWWNFLIYDGVTRNHWNIIYGVTQTPQQGKMCKVMLAHLRDNITVAAGGAFFPPESAESRAKGRFCRLVNHFDMLLFDTSITAGETPLLSMIAKDDDTLELKGSFAATETRDPLRADDTDLSMKWDVTLHRISGYYGNLDSETKSCFMASTLWGYHSAVQGSLTSRSQLHQFDRTSRFRVYSAGSWGCRLPEGNPAIEHPWTWFWLVVPNTSPSNDVALCGGTGRFQTSVGSIEGAWGIASLPSRAVGGAMDSNSKHVSIRYARMLDRTPLEFFLQASSSDGHFSHFTVTQSDWGVFVDEYGPAKVPQRQLFSFASANYLFEVDFYPHAQQYFRCPVYFEGKVFSDFRAVGVRTRVLIRRRSNNETVFDDWVNTHNAVEYAYMAELEKPMDPARLF